MNAMDVRGDTFETLILYRSPGRIELMPPDFEL